jgi:hypothetical protein
MVQEMLDAQTAGCFKSTSAGTNQHLHLVFVVVMPCSGGEGADHK